MSVENPILMKTGLQFFGRMSASISHEIKNVMAIINENAGLLKDITLMAERRPMSPERLERLADAIAKQVGRADGIVKTMNRFSHGVDQFVGAVDLDEMLTFLSVLTARLIEMRESVVETIPSNAPVTAVTSRFLLENLVWRCLDFATKAPPVSKEIRMSAEETDAGAQIRISGVVGLDKASPESSPEPFRDPFPSEEENALLSALEAELVIDAEGRELILALPEKRGEKKSTF